MQVRRGDNIVVRSRDGSVRDALVLDVLGTLGRPPYHVRWVDTGDEEDFIPGPDASVDAGPTYPAEYEPHPGPARQE